MPDVNEYIQQMILSSLRGTIRDAGQLAECTTSALRIGFTLGSLYATKSFEASNLADTDFQKWRETEFAPVQPITEEELSRANSP